jgi:tetratricopeptide (TPR) repeat protein
MVGNLDEAEKDCCKAVDLNPKDPVIYSNRMSVYRARNLWEKVIEDCTSIIELRPNDATAYTMRGAAHGKLRHLEPAIKDCRMAVDLSPEDAASHANLAVAYSLIGKWEKVCNCYIVAYSFLLFVLLLKKSVRQCNITMNLGQMNASILTTRGLCNAQLRRFDAALTDLSKVLDQI